MDFAVTARRAAVAGLALALLAGAEAQLPVDSHLPDHIQYVRDELGRFERTTLARWQRKSRESLLLVIAAGACGLVAAGLSQRARYRHVASAFGLAVSILTLIQQLAFALDYRALDRLVATADGDLADLRGYASPRYYAFETKDLENDWWDGVRASIARLHALELQAVAQPQAGLLRLLPRALAANVRPAWIGHPPQTSRTLSFVGEGLGPDLASAKGASRGQAEERARAHLVGAIPAGAALGAADRDRLARFLVSAAQVAATYTEYANGQYRHFTLLRLDRASLRTDALMFGIRERVVIRDEIAAAIASASPAP